MELRIVYINDKPVKMVYLTDSDKKNIKNMHPDCSIYAQYDNKDDTKDVIELMKQFKRDIEDNQTHS